ncbi:hypothetical protein SAMN05421805_109169 [Saccharopolyspora antimicrobica]|uniref:Uncharacterized protein n=1 Tax=Saccharopolyspora antimicrobica TaxID=455193 RepID=A0A1I5EHW0_9PSEU|nr:hypothetical protein [Saccharopolyspora antimicrobica]RKT86824.1 hypothetical protein ATL45_5203 [Saccharopolyspora antimicrobica]SFO11065.1 hypothetical protein SAMN05421805_109169 [Saccharopolyspora antimicrobica]
MPLQTAQRPTAPTTPHDTAPEAEVPQPPAEPHDEDHVIRGYD